MKKWIVIAALLTASMALADSPPPLQTVPHVDLARYTGHWYEIARYPNWFEHGCASNATASYTVLADGKIEVINTCRTDRGKIRISRGKAVVADSATNAKLKVSFFWPFSGNYWIIDLAPDYSYAVVGEPRRGYLWILSRTPELSDAAYSEILTRMLQQAYDPRKLVKTPQTK